MPALFAPPRHTALSALPAAALDLETTGLDVRADRVVQVGVVTLLGPRILDQPRLDLRIDPAVPVPAAATAIHGLGEAELRGAPRFAAVAERLQGLLAGRVVIGHHIGFDLAVLRHEAARAGLEWPDLPVLDVVHLAGALEPGLPDLGFERLARLLGVTVRDRHSALADSLAAAEMFVALLPRLRAAEVRTLGEAQALAGARADLLAREEAAGWYLGRPPGVSAPAFAPLPAGGTEPARIDAQVYRQRLADVMRSPLVTVDASCSLREAARRMLEHGVGALVVGEPGAPPLGMLTERDLLRATVHGGGTLEGTVGAVMSAPVVGMPAEEMLYRGLGRMDRMGVRHLCVVGPDGAGLGMVSQRDLLAHRARAAAMLGDALEQAQDATELAAAYGRVPELAQQLRAEGLDGAEIAGFVSSELRVATARAAQLAEAALRGEGAGRAPAAWCLLVLGSGGRGESLLGADQDNALIHAGGPGDDAWFAQLGRRAAQMLDEAGIPRCAGGVMAANEHWRGNVGQWRTRIADWLRRATPEDLLSVDIFYDLLPVVGDRSLAERLHADAVAAASGAPPFIALLAETVGALRPPLGFLGRWRTDAAGRVDLKRAGLLPLVSLARTLALRIGSRARGTPERLRDAVAGGRLSEGDAETLVELHRELLTLVLDQQLADLVAGMRPSGRIEVAALGRRRSRRLRTGLRRLDEMLGVLRGNISG